MMQKRPAQPSGGDEHWFGFASALNLYCASDYIALRLMCVFEPFATTPTIYVKMIEVIEKALKVFISVRSESPTAISDARFKYGHNLKKLRESAGQYEAVFNDQDICDLTQYFNDNGGRYFQHLRYGSGMTITEPRTVDLKKALDVVDKIYFKSLILIPDHYRRMFLETNFVKHVFFESFVQKNMNLPPLKTALLKDNQYINEFIKCCEEMEKSKKMMQVQAKSTIP